MRVTHISVYDLYGGAARAAYRLHKSFIDSVVESKMLVLHQRGNDPTVSKFSPSRSSLEKTRRLIRRWQIKRSFAPYQNTLSNGFEPFTSDRTQYSGLVQHAIGDADIVNLHWITNFVDIGIFLQGVKVPVVWTLHDMNALTGGCHYDAGCKRFLDGCGFCPQLNSNDAYDLSHKVWKNKRGALALIDPSKLHIVTPSKWLNELVCQSPLLNRFASSLIPYGLDTSVFKPLNKLFARHTLNIPQDANVVLYVSHSIRNRRKGFDLLFDAMSQIDNVPNLFFLSIGRGNPAVITKIPHRYLGVVEKDWVLALIYSAADVFVIPSRQDNLPNTVLESMACGTPIVGFDIGGIPDMVRTGVTGLLAPIDDIHTLRDYLVHLLQNEDVRKELSIACRKVALEEYAMPVQADRYVRLYDKLIREHFI